ncbi:DUF4124 domain-containing protein [Pseudomonas typographi]
MAGAAAAEDAPSVRLYRYVDNRGVTVLDTQGVPPEYISKGYQVLNPQGRVIQTVPPAPSADEIKQRQAQQAQAQTDHDLLQRYSSLADLDREKARRLAEFDTQVGLANNNLLVLKQQQDFLQGQAADIERNGQPVPPTLVQQIDDVRRQQADVSQQIDELRQSKQGLAAQYDQQRARLQTLLGQ